MEDGRKKRLSHSEQEWKEKKASLKKEYDDLIAVNKKNGIITPQKVTDTYNARLAENDNAKAKRDADINKEALDEKVGEIRADGGKAEAAVVDVRNYEQVCAARDLAVEKFGSLDVVVNCAGGAEVRMCNAYHYGEFKDIPIDVYDWGIDVNLKGQLYLDHAAMIQMAEQKSGVIINIGSITGEEGCDTNVAYSSAKSGAMNGLTKSLALYGARYNVRVCCVSPGPVMTRPGMAAMKTLIGSAAEPKEIVDLIMYLASDKAAFITGINVLADGGRNIMRNK